MRTDIATKLGSVLLPRQILKQKSTDILNSFDLYVGGISEGVPITFLGKQPKYTEIRLV